MTTTKKKSDRRPKKLAVLASEKEEQELSSYDADFTKWVNDQARFLKKQEFSKLDIDNLIEEIEDLSKRESDKLVSHLENLLMHELKVKYQPSMHTASWDASIKEARFKVNKVLEKNPSLKPKLKELVKEAYYAARLKAVRETGLEENTFPTQFQGKLKDMFPDLEKKYY